MVAQGLHELPADEEIQSLEEQARPYRALYDHWERTQWTAGGIDFRTDAASYRTLSPEQQQGLLWIFSHRFHAEFSVATVLAPFISAAPSYETQLLLAAQVSASRAESQPSAPSRNRSAIPSRITSMSASSQSSAS